MKEHLNKELIIFDLDGTLAWSKAPVDPEVATLLSRLLEEKKVAVITGGSFEQMQEQLVNHLDCGPDALENLYLLPTSGAQMMEFDGRIWRKVYSTTFSDEERHKVIETIKEAYQQTGIEEPEELYGEQIEDRGTQITFSGLGQRAPLAKKLKWDPNKEKRRKMQEYLQARLPDAEVRLGGSTSVDVTKKGIDKAYGVEKITEYLRLSFASVLFVGDALGVGGNDHPVTRLPIQTEAVSGPSDTAGVIASLLA